MQCEYCEARNKRILELEAELADLKDRALRALADSTNKTHALKRALKAQQTQKK